RNGRDACRGAPYLLRRSHPGIGNVDRPRWIFRRPAHSRLRRWTAGPRTADNHRSSHGSRFMSRKLPARDDWFGLLQTARETALGCEPGDPVAHGRLVSTVGDECGTDNGTAGRWIDTAVDKGFLERRGSG